MRTVKLLGIDYSVQCPALCLTDGTTHQWFVNYRLRGKPYPSMPTVDWTVSTTEGDLPRFLELADWVVRVVRDTAPDHIALEDYAFSRAGRLTQLGENCGILKGDLWRQFPHIPLHIIGPTTMKKFATGKGFATKDEIWAAFIAREPHAAPWAKLCHPKAAKIGSPVADIADAYFLAQYGRTLLTT